MSKNVYGLKPCPNCGEVEKQGIGMIPIMGGSAIQCDACGTIRGPVRDSDFVDEAKRGACGMDTLKPCPFCGEVEKVGLVGGSETRWIVQCYVCGATSPILDDKAQRKLVEFMWNIRERECESSEEIAFAAWLLWINQKEERGDAQ